MELTTGELYEILPSMIKFNKKLYFPIIIKTSKKTYIEYKMNDFDGGGTLFNTYKGGQTLRFALIEMLKLLIENDLMVNDSIKQITNERGLIDIIKI